MIEKHSEEGSKKASSKRGPLLALIGLVMIAGVIGLFFFWPQNQSEIPAVAVAPSEAPSQAVAPSEVPSQVVAPSETPSQVVAPSEVPSQAVAPLVNEGDLEGMVRAALNRFETPALQEGLLHENYRITAKRQSWLLERWTDFSQPERFALFIRRENEQRNPFYSVRSDGVDRLEMIDNQEIIKEQRFVSELPSDLLKRIQPILLQQPYPGISGFQEPPHVERLFLNLALENELSLLGEGQFLGRAVSTIGYTHNKRFTTFFSYTSAEFERAEVVLTIDKQSYSLLQVELTLTGQTGSETLIPWRTELFSFDDQPDPELFAIRDEPSQELFSPRMAFDQELWSYEQVSLSELLEKTDIPIYLPPALAEEVLWGRAVYARGPVGELIMIVFESANREITYVALPESFVQQQPAESYKQSNTFSYAIDGSWASREMDLIDNTTGQHFRITIAEPFANEAERDRELEAWLNSFELLTPDTIDRFQVFMIDPQ
jgi:hypothetical protein